MSVEQGNDVDQQVHEAVRAFHQAFQDRDVEAMVAAYACQRTAGSPRGRTVDLPVRGQVLSLWADS